MIENKGLTLIELLITTTLASTLLLLAVPNLTQVVKHLTLKNKTTHIKSLIQLARSSAIKHGGLAIICSLDSSDICSNDWQKRVSIFIDKNRNYIFDGDDILIRSEKILQGTQQVTLKMSAHKQHIAYNSLGVTHGTFGSLFFCQNNTVYDFSQKLIINRSGRVRVEYDLNQDGQIDGQSRPSTPCS